MTNQLKWRLGKLPTSDEVIKLLNEKIITKEEAKEILFNVETESQRDIESYKQEVKFLKEVIEKLADKNSIVQVVKEYIPQYITQPFYQPYYYWTYPTTTWTTTSASLNTNGGAGSGTLYLNTTGAGASNLDNAINCSFTSIAS